MMKKSISTIPYKRDLADDRKMGNDKILLRAESYPGTNPSV